MADLADSTGAVSIACIVLRDGRLLIAHRNPVGQMGGRWEFPGGKREPGEDDAAAVVREFREEFGVDVEVGSKIAEATFVHNGRNVALHAYRVFVPHDGVETPYSLSEHTEYRWALPSELEGLNFVDSDMKLYPAVRRYVEAEGDES
ncbi:MAG: NUDIX domain-containing protein [Treponema sp.]|nr:NUDIX domain-containing protein [Treponema sp.]MCR5621598.1 NUDIX domain-containing protein [Treponema sp.]